MQQVTGISTYSIKINGTKCEVCICMYCEYSFQSKLKDNHKFIQAVPPNSATLDYSLICNGTKKMFGQEVIVFQGRNQAMRINSKSCSRKDLWK